MRTTEPHERSMHVRNFYNRLYTRGRYLKNGPGSPAWCITGPECGKRSRTISYTSSECRQLRPRENRSQNIAPSSKAQPSTTATSPVSTTSSMIAHLTIGAATYTSMSVRMTTRPRPMPLTRQIPLTRQTPEARPRQTPRSRQTPPRTRQTPPRTRAPPSMREAPSNNNIPAQGRKNINIEQQQHSRLRAEEPIASPTE